MQDLKHLSRRKRRIGGGLFTIGRRTGNNSRSGELPPPRLRLLAALRHGQLRPLLLGIAILLALIPTSLLIYRKAVPAIKDGFGWLASRAATSPQSAEASRKPPPSRFETAYSLLDQAAGSPDRMTSSTPDGELIQYTIRGNLQQRVHDFLARYQVPYGAFVAVEPATGRILAMTSYSAADPSWTRSACFDLYPMASLFKIVTASAALEQRKITPDTVIEFRGKATSENPRYWEASPRGRNNRMDVTYAMGKSINPVYGRVACDIAGKASLMECVNRFGFNQPLFPGTATKDSTAADPQGNHGLMLMGAGLDHDVKISPLHAAVMMGAIANGGRMMAPTLTDRVIDRKGVERESFTPRELRTLVTPETASSLTRMLSSTVTTGTSRKAFHDRRGRPRVNVEIAAKTGTIDGSDPRGHYSWFAAYAPARDPKIALVALVINQDKWRIKSSQVGEVALEEFFEN